MKITINLTDLFPPALRHLFRALASDAAFKSNMLEEPIPEQIMLQLKAIVSEIEDQEEATPESPNTAMRAAIDRLSRLRQPKKPCALLDPMTPAERSALLRG